MNEATPKHFLVDDNGQTVATFEKFDKEAIKAKIIELLTNDSTLLLTHEKELQGTQKKRFYGNDVLNVYECNKRGVPCIVKARGHGELHIPLSTFDGHINS